MAEKTTPRAEVANADAAHKMVEVVFDASCALAFAIADETMHTAAVALVRHLIARNARLIAPALFDYETETVLRLKVFRYAIGAKNATPFTESDANQARAIIAALQVETVHNMEMLRQAYNFARDFGQARIYDASYAALAFQRGIEFWTADEDFQQAVNSPNIPPKKRLSFVHYIGEIAKATGNETV